MFNILESEMELSYEELRMLEKGVEIHMLVADENGNMVEAAGWRKLLAKIKVMRKHADPPPHVCQHVTGSCPWCRDSDDAA